MFVTHNACAHTYRCAHNIGLQGTAPRHVKGGCCTVQWFSHGQVSLRACCVCVTHMCMEECIQEAVLSAMGWREISRVYVCTMHSDVDKMYLIEWMPFCACMLRCLRRVCPSVLFDHVRKLIPHPPTKRRAREHVDIFRCSLKAALQLACSTARVLRHKSRS